MPGRRPIRASHLSVTGLAAALAAGSLFGLARPATAASCPQNGLSVICTFNNSGAQESFVVPAGVTSALFTVRGGSGGSGATLTPPASPDEVAGGAGGLTQATLALTPGTSLAIFVGGLGGDGQGCLGSDHGIGADSGGQDSGGDGGDGLNEGPGRCAGGGGGGASWIMPAGQIPGGPGTTVLLAAGGGGGGGGGHVGGDGFAGGAGGGNQSGPAGDGEDSLVGGAGGENLGVEGEAGEDAVAGQDGGGGGGGGLGSGVGANNSSPGGGGGGGEGFPLPEAEPVVVPATRFPASAPARPLGPATHGLATVGSAGMVTISFTLPATPGTNPTDTDQCKPGEDTCVVKPPAGQETKFQITAVGGKDGATLFGTLNGGAAPKCRSFGGRLSPDWVQFGFTNPRDGKTWSKRIRATGTDGTTKDRARTILAQTQICFAAPYKFVVKRGTELQRRAGTNIREGVLAHCRSRIIAEARENQPDLARPCVIKRTLVSKADGWVVRIYYKVPKGELDPQGRSTRRR